MLYFLAAYLHFSGVTNLFRYQSFRSGGAVTTALIIGLLIGPRAIDWLRVRQGKGQPIRDGQPGPVFRQLLDAWKRTAAVD